jgi:tRNA1Val (adenine37-N6)-methyltransferase
LFLIKCVKDAGKELKIHTPLTVYNEDGTYTDEILEIYNKKK